MNDLVKRGHAIEGSPRLAVIDDYEGMMSRAPAMARMRELAEVNVFQEPMTQDELVEALQGYQMLLTIRERTRLDARLFERLPSLKLVLQTGGHAYHVDMDAATRHGVAVALGRSAKSPTKAVPELVFGLAISLLRNLALLDRNMKEGDWRDSPELALGRVLHGRTLGILGLGRHGVPVARLAKAFGMEVAAWGPTLTDERAASEGVSRMELDHLISASDIVSIHLRLSDDSRKLLDRRRLSLMRQDAILINTARGAIVDEDALTDVLAAGGIAGAGLDVFADEPLANDSRLRSLPNVLLTPHIGWTVEEVFAEFAEIACDQMKSFIDQDYPSVGIVNSSLLDSRL